MATTSATLWPGMMWGSTARLREGGAPPLQAVRLRPAVGDQVAAELAAGAFHPRVAFALGHPHLPHRLHARAARRSGPRAARRAPGATIRDRLAELDHPHAIARVAVARRLHRHLEVEVPVGRVRLGSPHVVVEPGAADAAGRDTPTSRASSREITPTPCVRTRKKALSSSIASYSSRRCSMRSSVCATLCGPSPAGMS